MNRKIEFRAKRKDTNEWVYGFYDGWQKIPIIREKDGYAREVIPETVGEFIVREDNVDIFEKDIIEEWKHDFFIRRFVAEDIRTFIEQYSMSGHNSIWKVVGNTIDTP